MIGRLLNRPLTDDEAATRALILRGIAIAPNATARMRRIASHFTQVYDACRQPTLDGKRLTPVAALTIAADDTRSFAERLASEGQEARSA